MALFAISCSEEEPILFRPGESERVFARIESVEDPDTRVYADENLKVLWDADDRISLFNKYTYNKQYRFTGDTGQNSGEFEEVNSGAVITGNALDYVYAVYPYQEGTTISNDGIITLALPSEQFYSRDGSFGKGSNTMVSATTNTELLFKNLCGYFVLKLYGEDVSVASITLTGNNDEPLAGNVSVSAAMGATPSFFFSGTRSTSLTLVCPTPVTLGSTAEDATTFFFVVPPTTFSKGFTISLADKDGGTFEKATSSEAVIIRNSTYRMKALAVDIQPAIDYSKEYLTFEVLGDGVIGWKKSTASAPAKTISYSINGGSWTDIKSTTSGASINVATGDRVRFRGNNSTYASASAYDDFNCFTASCNFIVSGNIMSLIYGYSFEDTYRLSSAEAFAHLFEGCTTLVSAGNLILPATILSTGCYCALFQDCTSLISAPKLPATSLTSECYWQMFHNCHSLQIAPELPATSLATGCYTYMFYGCSSITEAPVLPATALAYSCYSHMFRDCTSLSTAPELPAMTLAESCYTEMFSGCTSLSTAPVLLATKVESYSYFGMFRYCKNLTYLKCLATNISASGSTSSWLDQASTEGVFVKAALMSDWTTGPNGIPSGWTVISE